MATVLCSDLIGKERYDMIPFVILAIEDENDRAFMTDLFLKYERLMYSEIRKIVKNQCDPEDILHSALVKLIEKIDLLKSMEERPRVNYLITTVKHTALSEIRRITRKEMNSIDDEDWYERDWLRADDEVEDIVSRREAVGRLEAIWPMLDQKSRFLLQARYFLEMGDSEISKEIGIKPDSVRMELSRARKKARDLLAEQFGMKTIW